MIISCPNCSTQFTVSDTAIPMEGRTVRCSKCGTSWHQAHPSAPEPPPSAVAEPSEPQSAAEPTSETGAASPESAGATPSAPSLADIDITSEDKPKAEETANAPDLTATRDEEPPRQSVLKKKPPEPKKEVPVIAIGWIVLAVLVVLVVGGAVVFRDSIVSGWPATERLYRSLGLSVKHAAPMQRNKPAEEPAAESMDLFKIVTKPPKIETVDGVRHITVDGTISNTGKTEMKAPDVRVRVIDDNEKVLNEFTQKLPVQTLSAGQEVEFKVQLDNPPADARRISMEAVRAR